MPFWSSEARARRVVKSVPGYAALSIEEIRMDLVSRQGGLPGLKSDGLHVGVNWTGKRASGWDMEPDALQTAIEAAMSDDIGGR